MALGFSVVGCFYIVAFQLFPQAMVSFSVCAVIGISCTLLSLRDHLFFFLASAFVFISSFQNFPRAEFGRIYFL